MKAETRRIVTEELWRSAAWVFVALVGWSVLVTVTPLEATAVTVVGLPALTVVGMTATMILIRLSTGRELKATSEGQQGVLLLVGIVAVGFLALYLVVTDEAGWWLFGAYLISVPAGLVLHALMKRRYPGAYGVD